MVPAFHLPFARRYHANRGACLLQRFARLYQFNLFESVGDKNGDLLIL
jgi:hypothetical protein